MERKVKRMMLGRADSRFFVVMHTLVYPGVLGSLMYAIPDNIVSGARAYSNATLFIAFAFFGAFIMDYTHSITAFARRNYSIAMFALDSAIVFLLFCAGQQILGSEVLLQIPTALLLAVAKVVGGLWEVVVWSPENSARNTDFVFALAYLILFLGASGQNCWAPAAISECAEGFRWALGFVLLADALFYLAYKGMRTN